MALSFPSSSSSSSWNTNTVISLIFLLLLPFTSGQSTANPPSPPTKSQCTRLKGASYCEPKMKLCITSEPNGTSTVLIRVGAFTKGWVAFGVGTDMENADMTVAWVNSKNEIVISDRWSTSTSQPKPKTKQISKIVPYSGYDAASNNLCFTFSRPIAGNAANKDQQITKAKQSFIWAYSEEPPTNIDDPATLLSGHGSNRGAFEANLLAINSTGSSSKQTSTLPFPDIFYLIHGILMVLAWFVLALFGSLTARFGRAIYGNRWFPIHVGIMISVILMTITAAAFAFVKSGIKLNQPHNVIGVVVTVAAFLQGILGYLIHVLYDPDRESTPWYDWLHRILGYVLVPLAIVNCILGFLRYKGGLVIWIAVSATTAVLIVIYFVVGYMRSDGDKDHDDRNSYEMDRFEKRQQQQHQYERRRSSISYRNRGNPNPDYAVPEPEEENLPFVERMKGWFGLGAGAGGGTSNSDNKIRAGNDYDTYQQQNYNYEDDQNDWTIGSNRQGGGGAAYRYYDDSYYSNDSRDGRYRRTRSRLPTAPAGKANATSYYNKSNNPNYYNEDRY